MGTLDDVATLIGKVATIESKLTVFTTLATGMPKLVQEVTALKGDIATLTKAIENLAHAVQKRTSDLNQMDNMLITRVMGMEQSFASMSKMFSAVVSELSDAGRLDQKAVLERLRKSDEANDKLRVEQMLQLKVIEATDKLEVGPTGSLIVISQNFTAKDGKVDIVAEYRALELSNPELDAKTKEDYVGKAVGDVIEL